LEPAVEVVRLDDSPEGIVQTAMHTLLRLAQQTRDLPTSLKAAGMLLDRTLGPVQRPQAPAEPSKEPEALPRPTWYDPASRLSYQNQPQSEELPG